MTDRRVLVQAPLRSLSLSQVRHIATVPYGAAAGTTARVYRDVERDFGVLAPPVVLHAPVPELLAACWMTLRETMLVPGRAPRVAKEAVAAAVSTGNQCPFCTTMHRTMHDSLSTRPTGPEAKGGRAREPRGGKGRGAGGGEGRGGGPTAGALARWVGSAGGVPPFAPELLPELAGTALCLHYLNRMVNVFLGPQPLPPHTPDKALGPVLRVLVGLMRGSVRGKAAPGASLDLLPPAPLPPDLRWAAAEPRIADALARSSAAVEKAAEQAVPDRVRAVLEAELAGWDGADPGLGRAWLDAPLRELPPHERPAAELALLTALASYRVGDTVVAACRRAGADDRDLLAVTSWASLRAARRRSRLLLPDN